jgi:hypothetical protein
LSVILEEKKGNKNGMTHLYFLGAKFHHLAIEKTGLPSNHRNVFLGGKKMAQSIAILQRGGKG